LPNNFALRKMNQFTTGKMDRTLSEPLSESLSESLMRRCLLSLGQILYKSSLGDQQKIYQLAETAGIATLKFTKTPKVLEGVVCEKMVE